MRTSSLSLALLLGLVWLPAAQAATYYVSPSGSPANDCATAQSSFPAAAKLTLTQGLSCLDGGDTLIVHPGTYLAVTGNCLSDSAVGNTFSGTPSAYTTIKASSVGAAVLQDTGPECPTGGYGHMGQTSYVVIDGFVFNGLTQGTQGTGGATTDESGIISNDPDDLRSHHVRWQNIEMRHMRIGINISPGGGFWEFVNVKILYTGQLSLGVENPDVFCNEPATDTGCTANYVHTGGPGLLWDHVEINGCTGYGMQFSSPSGYGPPPGAQIRNSIFANCEVGLYVRGGANVVNSLIHHNRSGMLMPDAGTIRFNTFVGNAFNSGVQLGIGGSPITLQNNIFLDVQGDFVSCLDNNNEPIACNLTVAANLCPSIGGTQGICTVTGTPAATFASTTQGDPLFLYLKAGSPALSAGVSITAAPEVLTDKEGMTRGSPPDLGAYTYTVGTELVPGRLFMGVQPSNTVSGALMVPAVTVTVRDATGVFIPTSTIPVTIALQQNPAGGTLSCGPATCTKNAVAGVAIFDTLSVATVGTGYTLRGTTTEPGVLADQSDFFAITAGDPGAAVQLAFGQPPTAAGVGVAITPPVTVLVRDAAGLVVPTATNAITLALATNPAGGTLSCGPATCTKNALAGEATFETLSIATAGTGYSLGATAAGLTGATSTTFAITSPPPAPTDLSINLYSTGAFLR